VLDFAVRCSRAAGVARIRRPDGPPRGAGQPSIDVAGWLYPGAVHAKRIVRVRVFPASS
jgi:hypothetical protein